MASNITVKITADTIDLVTQMKVTQAALSGTTRELNALARQAAQTGMTDQIQGQMTALAEKSLITQNRFVGLRNELKALQDAGNQTFFGSLMGSLEKLGPMLGLLGAGGGAFAILSFAKGALDAAANVQELSDKLGISVEDLQAFQFAARQAGVDTDDAGTALQRFMANLGQFKETGTGPFADTMRQLGITIDELSGDPLETLILVARKIDALTDSTAKAAAERDVFGRSGQSVNQMLADMASGSADVTDKLGEMKKAAADAGQMLNPTLTKDVKDAQISFSNWGTSLENVVTEAIVGTTYDIEALGKAVAGVDWNKVGEYLGMSYGGGAPSAPKTPAPPKRPDMGPAPPEPKLYVPHQDQPTPPTIDIQKSQVDSARKIADEIAQIQTQADQKHIDAEQRTNDFLLSMGAESIDQWLAQSTKLENERYQIELAGVQKREQADKGNAVALAKDQAQEQSLAQEHQDRLTAIAQQGQEKKKQLQDQGVADFRTAEDEKLDAYNASVNKQLKTLQISHAQMTALELQMTELIRAQVLARDDIAVAEAAKGTEAYRTAWEQREKDAAKYLKAIQSLNAAETEDEMAKWKTLATSSEGVFNSSLNQMIVHGGSLKQFITSTTQGIETAFLEMGEKIVDDWVMQQIFGQATQKETATSQIMTNAAVAASGAFATWSAAPFPLNLTAPAMAAGAYGEGLTFLGGIAAARGEWMVSGDEVPYSLHNREAVMPASVADPMRQFFSNPSNSGQGNNGGGSQGDVNLNVSMLDTTGLKQFVNKSKNRRVFRNFLRDQHRAGFANA